MFAVNYRNLASETESQMPPKDGTEQVAPSKDFVTMATQSSTAHQSPAEGGATLQTGVPNTTSCATEAQNNTIAVTFPAVPGTDVSVGRPRFLGGNPDPQCFTMDCGQYRPQEDLLLGAVFLDMCCDPDFRKQFDPTCWISKECEKFLRTCSPSARAKIITVPRVPRSEARSINGCSVLPESCDVMKFGGCWGVPEPRGQLQKQICVIDFPYNRYAPKWRNSETTFPNRIGSGLLHRAGISPYYLKTLIWKNEDGNLVLERFSSPYLGYDYSDILNKRFPDSRTPKRAQILYARYAYDNVAVRIVADGIATWHKLIIDKLLECTGSSDEERAYLFQTEIVDNPAYIGKLYSFIRNICGAQWFDLWYPLETAFIELLEEVPCRNRSKADLRAVFSHRYDPKADRRSQFCICDFWMRYAIPKTDHRGLVPVLLFTVCKDKRITGKIATILIEAAKYILELSETHNAPASDSNADTSRRIRAARFQPVFAEGRFNFVPLNFYR